MFGKTVISGFVLAATAVCAQAEGLYDPTPLSQQKLAVDGYNFTAALQAGSVGGWSNHMLVGSMAMPVMSNFGVQADVAFGVYGEEYTSAAGAVHLFWRDPDSGAFGIYGDWGYVNPEHSGRIGLEGAIYNGRFTFDFLVGTRFGQHVYTRAFDEIDLSYYFTDNFKASIGHRNTSRGNVANISFEAMLDSPALSGWSIYGEGEIGEDNYSSAFAGIRYSFGAGPNSSLISRDRQSGVKVRIPRNLADSTRCGRLPMVKEKTFWRSEMSILCASEDELHDEGAVERKE